MTERDTYLAGYTIACLESRRGPELTRMIERAGGSIYLAPTLREVPLEDDGSVRDWLRRLAAGRYPVVIFLTGVGCRLLLEEAERLGLLPAALSALSGARVIARGPKPLSVLRQYGVRVDLVPPEPNTSEELLGALDGWDLGGATVGLQVYGGSTPYLTLLRGGMAKLGARLEEVSPYRWEGPGDALPVRELIERCVSGQVDALAVFSSSQIHNLFQIAEEFGEVERLRQALTRPRVVVAAVGPVTAQAIEEHGVKVDVQPEHPKMGHLLRSLGEALNSRREAA